MHCANKGPLLRAFLVAGLLMSPLSLVGAAELEGVVNVNTATVEQLEMLPQIGATKARAIVAHRKEHGPFEDVQQLVDVPGIGERALAEIAEHCVLDGRTTATVD